MMTNLKSRTVMGVGISECVEVATTMVSAGPHPYILLEVLEQNPLSLHLQLLEHLLPFLEHGSLHPQSPH